MLHLFSAFLFEVPLIHSTALNVKLNLQLVVLTLNKTRQPATVVNLCFKVNTFSFLLAENQLKQQQQKNTAPELINVLLWVSCSLGCLAPRSAINNLYMCASVYYLNAVEGSALLLVQQRVVVGQFHQLVQLLVGIFLLQLLQDTNHLQDRPAGNS